MNGESLQSIKARIHRCRRVLFITGAGISAESGLPTYRGVSGLYETMPTDDGMPIEEALSGTVFRTRPQVTWKYLALLEASCRGATFNRAHQIIAESERRFEFAMVLTQNVDGFHHNAGSSHVIDIHGNLHDLVCPRCDWQKRVADYRNLAIPPSCPNCRAILRPDVVLFGEMLPTAKLEQLMNETRRGFDLVFSIGTSSLFPYIVEPVYRARQAGALTIEINPDRTPISDIVHYKSACGAIEGLTRLLT